MLASVARQFRPRAAFLGGGAAIAAAAAAVAASTAQAAAPAAAPLSPAEWRPLKLLHREQLTAGDRPTYLLRFELPAGQPPLPVASCLLTRLPVGDVKEDGTRAWVLRPYTPVSAPDAPTLDLALKVYGDGKLTPALAGLQPGAVLDFKGPLPKIPLAELEAKQAVGMVAGGTGITPMLQIADEMLRRGYPGKISMVYANVSPADIMLKDRVDALQKAHPANFSVHYLVDRAAPGWTGGVGYVTAEVLRERLPAPGPGAMVLVCGPPGMMKAVSGEKVSPKDQGPLAGLLKGLGYTDVGVYKF